VWTLTNPDVTIVAGDKTWDAKSPFLASIQNGKNVVTTTSSTFSATDKNKFISSGYALPTGTYITGYVDPTTVTVSQNATKTVSSGVFAITSQPSLCDSRTLNDHPGTEFIFGGSSRVSATDGKFEICSPRDGDRQQIAVYGAKTAPGNVQAQNGCVTQGPYPTAGCPFIYAAGNRTVFLVHGTLYAPSAALDLGLQLVDYQMVSRGIVARVVRLGVSPSSIFNDPVIYSPDYGNVVGYPRRMLFTAYECAGATCTSGGVAKLRSKVSIQDADNEKNPSPGFKVNVESWTILR
jgi:hypothetical protein